MQRRDFLRLLGIAGASPLVAACARAFRPSHAEMLDGDARLAGAERDPEGVWREAAAYARWTPSPHNIQPWRLRLVDPRHAELYYDPRRLLPVTDPSSSFTSACLAMYVESLSVAMRPRGYEVRPEYFYKPLDFAATRPVLFARLTLVPAVSAPAFDRELILRRKTSRLPYDGTAVETAILGKVGAHADAQGHHFGFSSDPDLVEWAIDLNRFTLFSDLDDEPTRAELRRWIRCTDEEAAEKKDGLWSHCLRFPGRLLKSFFDEHQKYVRGWRRDFCGKMLVKGMAGTRTLVWWSGPMETPEDWIRSGVIVHRSWLELARNGIQMHPFGSIITNPKAHERLIEKLGASEEGPGRKMWLLARVGRSAEPPRSYRLEESAVFLDDKELA
jgi:hypothetical protein